MNRPLPKTAPFPDHQFDFGDYVHVITLQEGGIVEGIWHQGQTWQYRVVGLSKLSVEWWDETELKPACPQCLSKWDQMADCPKCGFSPDNLT